MDRRGAHLRPLSQGSEPAGAAGGTLNFSSSQSAKNELRQILRRRRSRIPRHQRDGAARRATRHLLRTTALRRARCVALYLDYGSELPTRSLIAALRQRGVRVLVPRLRPQAGRMDMVMLSKREAIHSHRGRKRLTQPLGGRCVASRSIDVLVLPLVGYDLHGTRLGSGGGYYDRWLARCRPRARRIGWGFSLQQVPNALPRESWDKPLHAVCTERGLRYFSFSS